MVINMDKGLIEKYKNDMLKMYRSAKPVVAEVTQPQQNAQPNGMGEYAGGLSARVTAFRSLYPVPRARITVFTGNVENMNVVDTDTTDISGKSKVFVLDTPQKSLSLSSGESQKPYALYNMLIEADGYISNIHLNIPVFSDTVTIQNSDMILRETAGENKSPQVFDQSQQFTL